MKRKVDRSYSHKELSLLYFPASQPHSASVQLSKWITRDKELLEALTCAGYIPKQRWYSPRQVTILFRFLGNPEKDQQIKKNK